MPRLDAPFGACRDRRARPRRSPSGSTPCQSRPARSRPLDTSGDTGEHQGTVWHIASGRSQMDPSWSTVLDAHGPYMSDADEAEIIRRVVESEDVADLALRAVHVWP